MSLAAVGNLALVYRLLFAPEYAGLYAPAALAAQVRMLIGSFRAGWSLSLVLFGLHVSWWASCLRGQRICRDGWAECSSQMDWRG